MQAYITCDSNDLSMSIIWSTVLPLLKQFGVPVEDLQLQIVMKIAPSLVVQKCNQMNIWAFM